MRNKPHESDALGRAPIVALLCYTIFFAVLFAPGWTRGLLAPTDALAYHYPAFQAPLTLWSEFLFSGYPISADPQFQLWYPPRIVTSNFNVFVVSAYVIAAFSTYLLVREITGDDWSAGLSGIVYACGGFMMGHACHTAIIHGAAWLPALMLVVLKLGREPSRTWWALAALCVALIVLSGHPQIAAYALAAAGGYAVYVVHVAHGLATRAGLTRLAVLAGAVLAGLAISAIQVLPLLAYVGETARSTWTHDDFIQHSLPAHELQIFFPYLYGRWAPYEIPYFGASNAHESLSYFGIASLSLIVLALMDRDRARTQALFWAGAAIAAFVFMLGSATPLSKLFYQLPVLGSFRVPARASMVLTLCAAVLAGIGVSALRNGRLSGRAPLAAASVLAALMMLALAFLISRYPGMTEVAGWRGIKLPPWWWNPVVGGPLLIAGLAIAALVHRRRSPRQLAALLAGLVSADLVHFSLGAEWRPTAVALSDPAWVSEIRSELAAASGRYVALGERASAAPEELRVPVNANLNAAYGLPGIGGYTPLAPFRYVQLAGLLNGTPSAFSTAPHIRQLLGITHVFVKDGHQKPIHLGACGSASKATRRAVIPLALPIPANQITVRSALACATTMKQGAAAARIKVRTSDGRGAALQLRSGIDTADLTILSAGATMQHGSPKIAAAFAPTQLQHFATTHPLWPEPAAMVTEIEIEQPAEANGRILVLDIMLEDTATRAVRQVPLLNARMDGTSQPRLRRLTDGWSVTDTPEPAAPAWFVERVVAASDETTQSALRDGITPDGAAFDVQKMAFVEKDLTVTLPAADAGSIRQVKVRRRDAGRWSFATVSDAPAFLVVSLPAAPGWHVLIDGRAEAPLRTNLALQGVIVPSGSHTVEFVYDPPSFRHGALLTALALCLIGFVLASAVFPRRSISAARAHQGHSA